ncbi:prepilin-type N-terminal cleavage/methylation domain-containing protein, partial [Patescibacteria group bacterium]|nr:prepilin-type N-terminal cleavage/methylation domain-containing protein [Patescibacteria group bacterium]
MATNKEGFTLIEIMVSVSIFAILVTTFTGFFIGAIQGQQKALASQELINNVSYTLEYMSRAVRMAKKELSDPPDCLSSRGLNYEKTKDGKGLKFINYDGICQEFFWDVADNRLKESKSGGIAIPLTPINTEVVSFKLGPSDSWGQDQGTQPKVTIFLEIKGRGLRMELQPLISIQTTISQRN